METWKCVHTLNSHSGDVLDIAWAPHDGWLASGSVDNTVIIWNTQKFPEKVVVLKGHTGMVKASTRNQNKTVAATSTFCYSFIKLCRHKNFINIMKSSYICHVSEADYVILKLICQII